MAEPDQQDVLPSGRFSGPVEFRSLMTVAVAAAAREGWREMVWSDADFADWPLQEREFVEQLNQWSRQGRRLIMIAHHYDSVVRLKAKFVDWRVRWDHIIECRMCKNLVADEFPSIFWSPAWFVHRINTQRSSGVSGVDLARRGLIRSQLDECYRQSTAGFPASTLGL
jgi:hypothetical protein